MGAGKTSVLHYRHQLFLLQGTSETLAPIEAFLLLVLQLYDVVTLVTRWQQVRDLRQRGNTENCSQMILSQQNISSF